MATDPRVGVPPTKEPPVLPPSVQAASPHPAPTLPEGVLPWLGGGAGYTGGFQCFWLFLFLSPPRYVNEQFGEAAWGAVSQTLS